MQIRSVGLAPSCKSVAMHQCTCHIGKLPFHLFLPDNDRVKKRAQKRFFRRRPWQKGEEERRRLHQSVILHKFTQCHLSPLSPPALQHRTTKHLSVRRRVYDKLSPLLLLFLRRRLAGGGKSKLTYFHSFTRRLKFPPTPFPPI